jgi:biopolymer transport protein ExbD
MTEQPLSHKKFRRSTNPPPARPLKLWNDRPGDIDARIEIIPLIDVIFCILTFFILASVGLSRQQAISLNLPKAASGTPQMREMLVVSLDDFGQVYVEKQAITRNQLLDAIKNYHQFNPNGVMVLNASRNASYNEVIQVLDVLRQVGGDRVALATLPGESDASANWNYPTTNPNPGGSSLPGNYAPPLQPTYPSTPSTGLNQYPPAATTPGLSGVPAPPNSTTPNSTTPGLSGTTTAPDANPTVPRR